MTRNEIEPTLLTSMIDQLENSSLCKDLVKTLKKKQSIENLQEQWEGLAHLRLALPFLSDPADFLNLLLVCKHWHRVFRTKVQKQLLSAAKPPSEEQRKQLYRGVLDIVVAADPGELQDGVPGPPRGHAAAGRVDGGSDPDGRAPVLPRHERLRLGGSGP